MTYEVRPIPASAGHATDGLIPEINSSLFAEHPARHLAVGIVARGLEVESGRDAEAHAYGLLRGNVYAHERHYMPVDDLQADGTESDEQDARSIHFALVENRVSSSRLVGAMRVILKARLGSPMLPVEEHYPEAFTGGQAPALSVEISRLISRHEDPTIQRSLKWPLFTAALSYLIAYDLTPAYGAVEEVLLHGLLASGVPVVQIGEPKFVPEFNASKLPIRVDLEGLRDKIETNSPGELARMRAVSNDFVYVGEL